MRIPVGSLIADLGEPAPITIERAGAAVTATDAFGDPIVAAPTEILAVAITHMAGRETIERAKVDTSAAVRAFYTTAEIRTVNGADSTPADVVVYNGQRWLIVDVADYSALSGIYLSLGSLVA